MKELKNVKKESLKLIGYMVYKVRKCINFYSFSPNYEDVVDFKNDGYKIANVYDNNIYELEDGRYFQEV